jgi:hypothetical protein
VTMQISLILPQIVALDVVFALAACLQTIHVPLIASRRSSYNRKVICEPCASPDDFGAHLIRVVWLVSGGAA